MLGCGIDLVETARVRRAIERHGDRFIQRVFTADEATYCQAKAHPWSHWAVRFAAKEALFKSLKPGSLDTLVWREIGVARHTTGAPRIELAGQTAARLRGWRFVLALSHERELAIAQVLSFPPDVEG